MDTLTRKQREILKLVQDMRDKNGITPTQRELAVLLRVTPNAVRARLTLLARKGYIMQLKRRARGIIIVHDVPRRPVPLTLTLRAGDIVMLNESAVMCTAVDGATVRFAFEFPRDVYIIRASAPGAKLNQAALACISALRKAGSSLADTRSERRNRQRQRKRQRDSYEQVRREAER